ncbi:MAG: phosphoribosylformylglycinamidine synthase, purS protein, partial [Actinobacteria bacterium RBG_16_64_13]
RALPALGHSGAANIRVGRYITLEVAGGDPGKVKADVDDMCRRLLANPIIEDYRFEIFPAGPESEGGGA